MENMIEQILAARNLGPIIAVSMACLIGLGLVFVNHRELNPLDSGIEEDSKELTKLNYLNTSLIGYSMLTAAIVMFIFLITITSFFSENDDILVLMASIRKYTLFRMYTLFIPLIMIGVSLIFVIKVVYTGKCNIANITLQKIQYINVYTILFFVVPTVLELYTMYLFLKIIGEGVYKISDKLEKMQDKITHKFNSACKD